MRDAVLILKKRGSNRANLVAVCASKRVAVKLILEELLTSGDINTSEIGAVRKFINLNEKTSGFSENYLIEFKPTNKMFTE